MKLDNQKIKDILLRQNYVSSDDINKAEEVSKKGQSSLIEYLLEKGLITRNIFGQTVAESLGIAYADLSANQPTRDQVLKIPEEVAKKYHAVVFREEEKSVIVATDSPSESGIFPELQQIFKSKQIILAYALSDDISQSFVNYRQALETRFSKIISAQRRVAPEIIGEILEDALAYRASDIHIEPQ